MRTTLARDERELAVDLAADRLGYLVLSFGVLALAAYRSLAHGEVTWDLLALVVLGGAAGAVVRINRGVATWTWGRAAIGAAALGLVVAVALVLGGVR